MIVTENCTCQSNAATFLANANPLLIHTNTCTHTPHVQNVPLRILSPLARYKQLCTLIDGDAHTCTNRPHKASLSPAALIAHYTKEGDAERYREVGISDVFKRTHQCSPPPPPLFSSLLSSSSPPYHCTSTSSLPLQCITENDSMLRSCSSDFSSCSPPLSLFALRSFPLLLT